ncbi:MAG TPA: SpoIID/LytB domain-containing protein, partial [Anaerovoracaceae bacterium]|nr:SpoIID/LytB domain-containing protein [Anaerovoracaceae bacterium]
MKYFKTTIIIIMFTFLLLPFSLNFNAEAATHDDYVKIGLKYGSSSAVSCTIKSEEGFILGKAENRSFEEGMPLPAYTELVITNENGSIVIRDENGTLLSADLGFSGCIMPADYEDDGVLYYEDTPYRDGIMLLAKTDGTITVINYITLEHYVYGVLNSELYYTNPEEALKAQAVAARSFGELNLGKHSADGFDLCTTTHCQVYKGFSGEYPSTISATDATRGEMIYYDGKPVTAYYYKNSGGYTQNVEDVWSFSQPYLKSIKDEYSPSYPWSTSLSFDTIRQKLEAAGYSPGTIQSIAITGRNSTGAVCELTIAGDNATVCLTKEKIRNVLGATIIKSLMFQLGDSYTEGSAGSTDWKISNGFTAVSPGSNTYVISGNGTTSKSNLDSIYVTDGTSTNKLGGTAASEIVAGETASFSGYGYGHGVGMPQDSAIEMAKQGFT